jgi:hypothetical protein
VLRDAETGGAKLGHQADELFMKTKTTALLTRLRNLAFAGSVLCFISSAQPTLVCAQETFHARGKIVDSHNSAIAGAEVKFEGSKTAETVTSDRQGSYYAELPVGSYSMTVTKSSSGRGEYYRRPVFRVSSPKTIVLDATLYPALPFCDPGYMFVTRPDGITEMKTVGADALRDSCGGWDRFPIFSDKDASYDLFVRYSKRQRSDGARVYNSELQNPVLVTFNLVTLTADHVTYDMANRTLQANGNVVLTNGSGRPPARATAMNFRIVGDNVLRLPSAKANHSRCALSDRNNSYPPSTLTPLPSLPRLDALSLNSYHDLQAI